MRKDKSVLGSDAGEHLSDVRDEERQDREKHGGKECATNKKKRQQKRDNAYTLQKFKKTDRDGETAQKRKKERVCVCVTENKVRQKARERQ